ncbi:uncharacterized protein CEXT_98731 [Caerostris extrusa]|uniref:Uncharacterized protein n=1 Tax=Caerostris extrusa TaxID=172846 RepID=A0AAV4QAJ3_CAEEX|nr:uncharacterized protein CEXT_98731 [Caerostris extrusa]
MDNPLCALLFAEDLVESILKKSGIEWEVQKEGVRYLREHIKKERLSYEIVEGVHALMVLEWRTICYCYTQLISKGVDNRFDYNYETVITTIYYFNTGYDSVKYLKMCALLCGLTLLYFQEKDKLMSNEIAHASCEMLAYIINLYMFQMQFNAKEDWFVLSWTAQVIRRKIKNKQPIPMKNDFNTKFTFRDEPQQKGNS